MDNLVFPGFMSGGIKARLLNSGLLHFTLGITHQLGVWSSASMGELHEPTFFLLFPCEFHLLHWRVALSPHSSESTHCHRCCSHKLGDSCMSPIQRTSVMLYGRLNKVLSPCKNV